jgi:hypothetical protein
MARIGLRVPATILVATATLGVLMGIGALAEIESARDLLVVAMPEVAVAVYRSAVLAESCTAEPAGATEHCVAEEPDVASVYPTGSPM